ncbi:MAG: metallophosphoesterase family protein [Granulosicoccaceae bacterium]
MADYTKVMIVSDTHGQIDPHIAQMSQQVDFVLHCGDIGDAHVLGALQPRRRVHVITGNNDTPARAPSQDLPLLANLSETLSLDLPGGVLLAVHGHRQVPASKRHQILRRLYPDVRCIAYGHSHRLLIDDADTPQIVNPGAAGRDRTHGGPSCLILDASKDRWYYSRHRFPLRPVRRRSVTNNR